MNGAANEELAELAFLTSFTTGWSSILHASCIELEAFKKQFDEAAKYMAESAKH